MREKLEQQGKHRYFEVFQAYDQDPGSAPPRYSDLAARLNLTESDVRHSLHYVRGRLRQLICEEVADSVDDPSEIEEEINQLLSLLR